MIVIPKYGQKNVFVGMVQKALNHFGANPRLAVDNDYGPKTKLAASKFQKKSGLPGSGNIGPKTVRLLGLQEALKIKVSNEKFANKSLLLHAQTYLGVREVPGKGSNPVIERFLAKGGSVSNDAFYTDDVPWCSGYTGCVIEEALGIESSNSLMARSYERMGFRNVIDNPLPGDVYTMYRNGKNSGSGHVGFYLGEDGLHYYILGGNQSDAVNVRKFPKRNTSSTGTTGIWRVVEQKLRVDQVAELEKIAASIINGTKIDISSSVV